MFTYRCDLSGVSQGFLFLDHCRLLLLLLLFLLFLLFLFFLLLLLLAEPGHRHLQLHQEQLHLAFLDELSEGLQKPVLSEFLTAEGYSFGCQVANCPVKDLQGEKLLNQRVVFEEGCFEGAGHFVLVDESALAREVFVEDCEDGEDVSAAGGALEEFEVDAEDGGEELSGEGEVELGVLADEFGDEGKDVEHPEFEALVGRVFLPRQGEEYLELPAQSREVVHHFPHEVDVGHEDRGVALSEEESQALEAAFELFLLGLAHVLCQLLHELAGFGLVLGAGDCRDEKLQRRFLEDDGGVRSLRLGGSGCAHSVSVYVKLEKQLYARTFFILLLILPLTSLLFSYTAPPPQQHPSDTHNHIRTLIVPSQGQESQKMQEEVGRDGFGVCWYLSRRREGLLRRMGLGLGVVIMNEYKILNIIGQGAFGNAYLATHLRENQNYVIKKVELTNKNKEQIENIYHEVKLLEQFKHVNIVSYRQSIREGQELNIVMEFCHGGDLNQLIVEQKDSHGGKKLEEKKVVDWAAQIALAIFYMHDKRILHRDLKTPNIFILDDRVKLGDFGISKVLDEKVDLASTSIGTPYYMSPEQYKHKPYSYKSDIWAFGCILYEMCNQKRPFQAYSLNGLAVKVLEANFPPVSECYSKELRELINKMLNKKQKERPSILQFLQTPIIKRRATVYLKQTYSQLVAEQGDKVLIEGVLYQAKKLGISLSEKKEETQKKSKPDFSAEKKRQEKERIRQQLEDELRKMSEKTKQQKEQLKQQMSQRKKNSDRIASISSRKSSQSISTKATREVQEHKPSPAEKKQFEIKEKYDMYEMEFEDQGDSEEEGIPEVDEEDDKDTIQQASRESKEQKMEAVREAVKEATKEVKEAVKEVKEIVKEKERIQEQVQADSKGYEKEKYSKGREAARFSQLASENPSNVETPIEEAILNLKESIKNNMKRINTITNEISAIDFSISSSSDDELEKTIDKPEELPSMKKKELNPVHVALTDKANDLKQTLEEILPKHVLSQLLELAKIRGGQTGRGELESVVGRQKGAFHLAYELVKLRAMLERIPLYVS